MSTQLRETSAQQDNAAAAARPPGWGAWIMVVLIVGAITAAVTVMAIWYFTQCGDCTRPAERSARIASSADC